MKTNKNKTPKSRKVISIVIIITLIILLFPCKYGIKDGGSIGYTSLTYDIRFWHAMAMEDGYYYVGTTVELFHCITIYDDVHLQKDH